MTVTLHAKVSYLKRRLVIAALLTLAALAFAADLFLSLAGFGDPADPPNGASYLFAVLFALLLVFLFRSARDAFLVRTDYLVLTEAGAELRLPTRRKLGWDEVEKVILYNEGMGRIRINRKPGGGIDILMQDLSEAPDDIRLKLAEASRVFGFELLV
ncbi:hypothetical protein [Gimibacter soli]|uniref:Uncharacterized protein n=1 Tax=Gimibacter soli TaxID=3024400 RepID=A0AAE9XTL0_9PROT|nr:hypothetical protein [Gimibacter soli]WCL54080.1 hypothetical protein PH603_16195 [Gimibacter soli]